MESRKLTCPFTGVEFELKTLDEKMLVPLSKAITHHPLLHVPVDVYINERWEVCVPLKYFDYIETVTPIQASEILGVTRQRITQIMQDNVIDSHTVNGSVVLKLSDVLEYKDNRKPGRPEKEG